MIVVAFRCIIVGEQCKDRIGIENALNPSCSFWRKKTLRTKSLKRTQHNSEDQDAGDEASLAYNLFRHFCRNDRRIMLWCLKRNQRCVIMEADDHSCLIEEM